MKIHAFTCFKFFVILFSFLIFSNCQSIGNIVQEPKLSFRSVDISRIDFSGAELIIHVDIENPNAFSIPLPNIDWELFINTNSFLAGAIKGERQIGRYETTTVSFPVSVSYDGLFGTFRSLVESNEAAYEIALGLNFPISFLADKVYRLNFSGVLPLLSMPGISFQGIARRSIGLIMEFVLTWEVENRNSFGFEIGEFNYNFMVNNNVWAQGRINNPPKVIAGGKTQIPLTVTINAPALVTELMSIITRGSSVSFNCTGGASLTPDFPGLGKLELPMNLQGNTLIR